LLPRFRRFSQLLPLQQSTFVTFPGRRWSVVPTFPSVPFSRVFCSGERGNPMKVEIGGIVRFRRRRRDFELSGDSVRVRRGTGGEEKGFSSYGFRVSNPATGRSNRTGRSSTGGVS